MKVMGIDTTRNINKESQAALAADDMVSEKAAKVMSSSASGGVFFSN